MGKPSNIVMLLYYAIIIMAICYYYYSYLTNGEEKTILGYIGMFVVSVFAGILVATVITKLLVSVSWILPLLIAAFCKFFNIR